MLNWKIWILSSQETHEERSNLDGPQGFHGDELNNKKKVLCKDFHSHFIPKFNFLAQFSKGSFILYVKIPIQIHPYFCNFPECLQTQNQRSTSGSRRGQCSQQFNQDTTTEDTEGQNSMVALQTLGGSRYRQSNPQLLLFASYNNVFLKTERCGSNKDTEACFSSQNHAQLYIHSHFHFLVAFNIATSIKGALFGCYWRISHLAEGTSYMMI